MILIGICLVVILSTALSIGLWWKGVSHIPDTYIVPSVETLICNNEIVFPIKNDKDALCFAYKDESIQKSMRETEERAKNSRAWKIKTTYNEIEKSWHIRTTGSGFLPLTCGSYFTENGEAIKTRSEKKYFSSCGGAK